MFAGFLDALLGKLWYWEWLMRQPSIFKSWSTGRAQRAKRRQSPSAPRGALCNNQHIGIHPSKVRGWGAVVDFPIREVGVEAGEGVVEVDIRGDLEDLAALTYHPEVWGDLAVGKGLICTMVEVL